MEMDMGSAKLAFRISEACEACGLGRTKLYEAIGAGALKARKADGRTVILAADLKEYLENLPLAKGRD